MFSFQRKSLLKEAHSNSSPDCFLLYPFPMSGVQKTCVVFRLRLTDGFHCMHGTSRALHFSYIALYNQKNFNFTVPTHLAVQSLDLQRNGIIMTVQNQTKNSKPKLPGQRQVFIRILQNILNLKGPTKVTESNSWLHR